MNTQIDAGWVGDPFGQHEYRYWDGEKWTEHVASQGQQTVDDPLMTPPSSPALTTTTGGQPVAPAHDGKIARQLRKAGMADSARGGGTLFTERVLVINQKAKLFERRAEYAVYDSQGQQLGSVREHGFSMSRAFVGRENETKRLQIVDGRGDEVLRLTRPATLMKSKVTVRRADGQLVGEIKQANLGVLSSILGGRFNIRFEMEANGLTLGTINAESWRAWDFIIQNSEGTEVARISKTWPVFAKQSFTRADNYVLEMYQQLRDPLLSMVVASALAIDTVLSQGAPNERRR